MGTIFKIKAMLACCALLFTILTCWPIFAAEKAVSWQSFMTAAEKDFALLNKSDAVPNKKAIDTVKGNLTKAITTAKTQILPKEALKNSQTYSDLGRLETDVVNWMEQEKLLLQAMLKRKAATQERLAVLKEVEELNRGLLEIMTQGLGKAPAKLEGSVAQLQQEIARMEAIAPKETK